MNGRGFDCLIVPFLLVFMFLLAVKFQFMPPFSKKNEGGTVEVVTHQEAVINKEKEKQRVEQLAKEAKEIRAEYQQAYKDCNEKSWSKLNSTVSIDVQYFFNSYTKTCTKRSAIAQVKKNSNGVDEIYDQVLSTEIVFVRSELRDYMLVYRQ
ncbi:hypothetical protein [Pseudomonas syringae]|uniref:hypothetical protein n=1 Tax=Pseudomonas syringae TaxID=317 RepID=UPI0011D28E5A|nr:hypothetical protein [Pseudomonas syringae]